MPGTLDPIGGLQGFVAQLAAIKTRIGNLEVWVRTAPFLASPTGAMVAKTRVFGTAYQPNVSRPTLVLLTYEVSSTGSNAGQVQTLTDGANPPTTPVATMYSNCAGISMQTHTILVPAGFYYKAASTGSATVTLISTYELTL